jgi:hypothetical protein
LLLFLYILFEELSTPGKNLLRIASYDYAKRYRRFCLLSWRFRALSIVCPQAIERPKLRSNLHGIPESRISDRHHISKAHMPTDGAEETTNGGWEDITYHTFEGVPYERYMSWEAAKEGVGRVDEGIRQLNPQTTSEKKTNQLLPAYHSVVVDTMRFKLVKKD